MSRTFAILGSIAFSLIPALFFCAETQAEMNLVPEGKRVLLMSSQRRATFKADDTSVTELQQQTAQQICSWAGKKLVRTTTVEITGEELDKLCTSKTYSASLARQVTNEGVQFEDATLVLHEYPITIPTPTSQKVEIGAWISTGVFAIGGGLVTLITLIGSGPPPDLTAVMVTGIIAGSGAAASAIVGGATHIYRKYNDRPPKEFAPFSDVENPLEAVAKIETFALPTLVSEIWCD
jgi:hypothetical protein